MGLILRKGKFGDYWGNTYESSNPLNYEQMQVNAKYIYSYLMYEGWTANAICGMLGNLQTESSINPGRWQSDRVAGDSSGHGYSLVQWTPYTKYTNWCGDKDPSEMDVALSRIIYELNNGLQWISTSQYPMTFQEFVKSNESPYNLAMVFIANYERPLEPNQPSRGTQAENWYNYLQGVVPDFPVEPGETKKKRRFPWLIMIKKKRRKIL